MSCPARGRLEEFRKANQENLAIDAEGNLTYLAAGEWRLQFVMEKWPQIAFLKTREHDRIPFPLFPFLSGFLIVPVIMKECTS